MSLAQLLLENEPNVQYISRLILEEFWNLYMPFISIDETVDGNLHLFADLILQLPSILDLEYTFVGIKNYLSIHVRNNDIDRNDDAYASWVTIGLLRFIGKEQSIDHFWYDAMG